MVASNRYPLNQNGLVFTTSSRIVTACVISCRPTAFNTISIASSTASVGGSGTMQSSILFIVRNRVANSMLVQSLSMNVVPLLSGKQRRCLESTRMVDRLYVIDFPKKVTTRVTEVIEAPLYLANRPPSFCKDCRFGTGRD